jgi:hypothetical protein
MELEAKVKLLEIQKATLEDHRLSDQTKKQSFLT